jgi:hypothetical protein
LRRALATLASALAVAACGQGDGRSGAPPDVSLGAMRDGVWRPFVDGDSVPIVLGPQGGYMVFLSLRGASVDPSAATAFALDEGPDAGAPLATADLRGGWEPDGAGRSVLAEQWVPFRTELWDGIDAFVGVRVRATAHVTNDDGQSDDASVSLVLGDVQR